MSYYHTAKQPLVAYRDQQLATILEQALQQPQDHLLIRVASSFDLHASQLPSIRTDHVRIEGRQILLPTGPRRALEPHPIPPDLVPELTTYLQTHMGEWLFTGRDGQMIRSEVKYRVKKYAVLAGFAQFRRKIGNHVYKAPQPPCRFTGRPHRPRPENTDPDTGKVLRDKPPAGLPKEDIGLILKTAKAQTETFAERNYVLLTLMYRYALRPGEPGMLLVHHVNLEAGRIFIVREKKGDSHEYLLFPELIPLLKPYLANRPLPETAPPSDVLFPGMKRNAAGEAYGITGEAVNKLVHKIATLAGFSEGQVWAYRFRHSAATHLLNAGWGIEDIRHHLGQNTSLATPGYLEVTREREAAMHRKLRDNPRCIATY